MEHGAFRVAQVGNGFLILRDTSCEAPPGTRANVIIAVDEDEVSYPVELPEGILKGVEFVDFRDLENCPIERNDRRTMLRHEDRS